MKNLLLLLVSVALCAEFLGFASIFAAPAIYSAAPALEARIQEAGPEAFAEFKRAGFSPVTGWRPPRDGSRTTRDCAGDEFAARHDRLGARTYDGYRTGEAEILLLGDSYTYGAEVGDDDTIAANLAEMTGRQVANLGMGAFGPVQAFLRGQSERSNYPDADTVVLGIMYENVYRMVNSYRPVYNPETGILFGLKPFMENGDIVRIDTRSFENFETFGKAARTSMRTDFWARPKHEFPYSFSMLRTLFSNYIEIEIKEQIGKWFYEKYTFVYFDGAITTNLLSLFREFSAWGEKQDLETHVVFIPQYTDKDIGTPGNWIETHRADIPNRLGVHSMPLDDVDKERYNQRPNDCHPSEYGYAKIAEFYKKILESD